MLSFNLRVIMAALLFIGLVAPMNINNPKSNPLLFDFDLAYGSDQDLELQRGLRQTLEEEMLEKGFE